MGKGILWFILIIVGFILAWDVYIFYKPLPMPEFTPEFYEQMREKEI